MVLFPFYNIDNEISPHELTDLVVSKSRKKSFVADKAGFIYMFDTNEVIKSLTKGKSCLVEFHKYKHKTFEMFKIRFKSKSSYGNRSRKWRSCNDRYRIY